MIGEFENHLNRFIKDETYSFSKLTDYFKKQSSYINQFKDAIIKDEQNNHHDLIYQYLLKQSTDERHEIFDEICSLHRKPFLTHRMSLSRIIILNEEVFLHILKNDRRFFLHGPEHTSVDVIEQKLKTYICKFYPHCFNQEKNLRKKEIYDALCNLEERMNPRIITTTHLHPGTGSGQRRRKRYCMTDDGIHEIIPLMSLVIRDHLEQVRYQI